jgi:hypothetical protein
MHCLTFSPPCSVIFGLEVKCGCKVTEVATKILRVMMAKMLTSNSVDVFV